MANERLTPARRVEHEDVVDGSRFIALVEPITSVDEASAQLARAREDHPDATHHCWAYRLGEEMRFSDDGEPGGTAGRPMLEVILKRGLDGCGAVVVRYFGGKKLGAGGLARAYGGAVARALDASGTVRLVPYHRLLVRAPFASASAVLRELPRARTEFDEQGLVAEVSVAADQADALHARLSDITRGESTIELLHVEEGPSEDS